MKNSFVVPHLIAETLSSIKMKSRELKTYHKTLSELNNSFTHYNFIWEQFRIDYLEKIDLSSDKRMTTEVFKENEVVETHQISMNKLEDEHLKTKSTLYEGIYVLIFTYFENYLKSLMKFAIKVDGSLISIDSPITEDKPDKILIDKFFNRIGINKSEPNDELIVTLDYLRLKRNRLIHKNSESISRSLRTLINGSGNNLNKYWNKRLPKSLQGIDFSSSENANNINWNILIDTINSMKGITFDIDELIINKLSKRNIFNQVVLPEYLSKLKGRAKATNIEKLIGSFERFSMTEYGLAIDDEMRNDIKSSVA